MSLTLALRHIRALENEVDIVELYIQAATDLVEDYTGRSLLNKSYRLDSDSFAICELKRNPVTLITSVKYYAPGGTSLTTLDSGNYRLDNASLPSKIIFASDLNFPDIEDRSDAVQIEFVAGYGDKPSDVDPALKLAVLQFAHHCYDNRVPVGDVKMMQLPFSLRHILRAKRV